jgi:hypothetical protein
MDTPADIIRKLDKNDQELVNKILGVEKKKMHIQKLNSRDEKEIVASIVKLIDGVVVNVN